MNIVSPSVLVTLTALLLSSALIAQTRPVRERIDFNESWRFQKGDSDGTGDSLAYDKIKDWVRATGNEFVRDGLERVRW